MRRVRAPMGRSKAAPVLPGKVEPTWFAAQWPTQADSRKLNLPRRAYEDPGAEPGTTICPLCHAISEGSRWYLDEQQYTQLRQDPDIKVDLCPADRRIQRQMFDGEVVLQGEWLDKHKEEVLNWVRNEEKRARLINPMARLATIQEREHHIYILTTSQVLARRIGSGMKSTFKGRLSVQKLPYEGFTRVRWARD
jgi:hypothetical protein